ncbi:MAG: hypothetical protein J1F27_01645, partial [Prevotellaceae bacterium]|nr:hypothetical protein [Prevotellaceae bacterium]
APHEPMFPYVTRIRRTHVILSFCTKFSPKSFDGMGFSAIFAKYLCAKAHDLHLKHEQIEQNKHN